MNSAEHPSNPEQAKAESEHSLERDQSPEPPSPELPNDELRSATQELRAAGAQLVQAPNMAWMKQSVHRVLAFGFGSGLMRPAPGTWGTLMAWLLWQPIAYFIHNDLVIAGLLVVAYIYGVYACQVVARDMGIADHGGVVWDEIVAFCLVLFVISPLPFIWQIVAFVIFRFFDIVKPWPIAFFDERLKNGFGVMWDDIIAALYSLFVLAVCVRIVG